MRAIHILESAMPIYANEIFSNYFRLPAHDARYHKYLRHQSQKSRQLTMQVVISPQSLLETGIRVEKVDGLRLFKFTDDLQDKLEELIAKNQLATLTTTEQEELNSISELDRIFTYLNSLLVAQK
jgi:hypothetical protein